MVVTLFFVIGLRKIRDLNHVAQKGTLFYTHNDFSRKKIKYIYICIDIF